MEKEMEKISPEVLIYIQSLRAYFENNEGVKSYFIVNQTDLDFFSNVTKIAQLNYIASGHPMLTIEQFEKLRNLTQEKLPENKITWERYQDFKEYGKFYLN
jgi:hypothetical protein